MNNRCIGLTAIFLALFAGACSQQIDPGNFLTISGKITMNGKPCKEAEVTFHSPDTKTLGRAVTDSTGQFTINEILPGEYTVSVLRMSMDGLGIAPEFEKFASRDSPLHAVVSEQQTTFEFAIDM
ncbi:carboxypeptidase-like regulatory domain-containing protein [Blastopirellula marina]|uniref:Lipoprotein n=1 Tax=Blastopirellula marina DSM 3645 TaxID=314230 RepID=A3ZWF6_9BACT|nr:carboxypeptidase-like regulatory domain-containing protein [Blastopirellula marina]EAQ79184.1 hypothetical protein DSM3645_26214 [Blastopirellula marina DSM 3645]